MMVGSETQIAKYQYFCKEAKYPSHHHSEFMSVTNINSF